MPALRPALLAALLAVGLLAAPALAAPPSGASATRSGTGPVWTAATVVTDGSAVRSRLRLTDVVLPLVLTARLYDAEQRLVSATNLTLRSPDEGVLVQGSPVGGQQVRLDELGEQQATPRREVEGELVVNPQAPVHVGTFTLVLWAGAADLAQWEWVLAGAPGTSLRGAGHGGRVHTALSRDFATGTVNAFAGVARGAGSASARVQADARHEVRAVGRLLGAFYPVLSSADSLSVTTPTGTRQCVPDCRFDAAAGPGAATAGRYTFRVTGAGAGSPGVQNAGDVVVTAAEVVLPLA